MMDEAVVINDRPEAAAAAAAAGAAGAAGAILSFIFSAMAH